MNLVSQMIQMAPRDQQEPVWLYTITGCILWGKWRGYPGEHFVGWFKEHPFKKEVK